MSHARVTPRLTDPSQAEDHFRSLVASRHFGSPSVLIVGCDCESRPIAHLHVLDCNVDASPSDCATVLDEMLALVTEDAPAVTGLCLGLTRPGGEEVQPYDKAWFRALYRVCHRHGLVPYGVYTVTRVGARPVHLDDAA